MDQPETRYATRDGLHIGYQLWGDGDLDILDLGIGTYISIDETADQPQWRRYVERLAGMGRVIRFDPSGIGMTDMPPDADQLTITGWADDALAVMDAVGSERAVVLGASGSSIPALAFAATHPDRTLSLVVINATARYVEADDYPIGISRALAEEFRSGLDPESDQTENELSDLSIFAPSGANDPDFRRWWSRASRRGATPATSAVLSESMANCDVRHLLPEITAPALVLHRRNSVSPTIDHGEYLARHIADARFVAMPGADVIPFLGNLDELVDHIQEFLTGERYQPEPARRLSTVLFTDIVDSTANAAEVGDNRWTRILGDYTELVGRHLERFGGAFVKDTGDGLLATFDTPASAIRCALALRDGATRLGIQVRSGLHTGEIEQVHGDVRGIAVHVAARVAATASAGEVLVSDVVRDLVEGSRIDFEDRGVHELKGVERPRHLWAAASA